MNEPTSFDKGLSSLLNKASAMARGFGLRVLIHLTALYTGALVFRALDKLPRFPLDAALTGFGLYLGIICLLPRGISRAASWLVPTLCGLGQGLALYLLDMPWQMAVFWGGLQTWTMRFLLSKGKMGWEWAVSPFLAIVTVSSLLQTKGQYLTLLPLVTVPVGVALGMAVARVFSKKNPPAPDRAASPKAQPPRAETEPQEPDNLKAYRDSAWQLEKKKFHMPKDVRPHLEGIRLAVDSIVDCMKTDPEDLAPGEQFLQRYLPAAHKVVDEHIRLAREAALHQNVADALSGTKDLLARLEKAFVEEHGRLLQNDALNFTVELNVLDKLLKMQGR